MIYDRKLFTVLVYGLTLLSCIMAWFFGNALVSWFSISILGLTMCFGIVEVTVLTLKLLDS